jgi:hypothetical protein
VRWLRPTPTPYDPLAWVTWPLARRGREACQAWALDGYGTPLLIYMVYVLKVGAYVGGWWWFCSFTPGIDPLDFIAFEKAILWSMLFEGLGLGCGSGPLTGRYVPPIGGFLHWLRPGTLRLPLSGRGRRRGWLEVALYAALIVLLVRALVAAAPGRDELVPIAVLVPVLGVVDRTIFLALRAEHYWVTIVCLCVAGDAIAGAKAVQLALWFWAGVSKLNHHFPTVVCVMTSNSPFTRFAWLRKLMYRAYPDDLRPSSLAVVMSHMGTALELGVPLVLVWASGSWLIVGLVMMCLLHTFITSNVPMGVPIEWNVMVVYGGFVLFGQHPGVHAWDVGAGLGVFLVVMLVIVPLVGNLWPKRVSFLLAMRYYAGNWPYSVWLFRGESYRKLDRLTKAAPWIHDQLARFYDRATSIGLVGKVMAFRLMHLQGRALPVLIPRAGVPLEECEYLDGEIVAGLALGWNFGDGHLHDERFIAAIQAECAFEPGEARVILVESQPLGRATMAYRIVDVATGELERGELDVRELREHQPWEAS